MKNRMCIILYFFIFICSFGYEGENFKKLQGKIFENEVNVSGITVENFLIFLFVFFFGLPQNNLFFFIFLNFLVVFSYFFSPTGFFVFFVFLFFKYIF